MAGTGPSAAAGTTGVPWRKVTWVTALQYAAFQAARVDAEARR